MIFDLPFDIVFVDPDGQETVIDGWLRNQSMGYSYFEANLDPLHFAVQTHGCGEWYLKISNRGSVPVAGFAGVRFAWQHGEDGYTLIPGVYYDGNYHDFQRDIPVLHMPEKPRFAASVSASTFPTALVKQGRTGWVYGFSPTSLAGWNGIALDGEKQTLTLFTPAREEKYYTYIRFVDHDRPAHIWQPREVV